MLKMCSISISENTQINTTCTYSFIENESAENQEFSNLQTVWVYVHVDGRYLIKDF